MNLFRVGFVVLVSVSFILLRVYSIARVGGTSHWEGRKSFTTEGSHPALLVWSFVAIVFFVALMTARGTEVVVGFPSFGKRAVAFCLDFWFSVLTISSIGSLVPLWIEARRAGHFSWYFERNYIVPTDATVGIPLVFADMALIFLYFAFPLTRGRQTVGCFILGLKVTPPFGDRGAFTFREAVRRTWSEFKGLCSFSSIGRNRDAQGRTWYDQQTNCTVVSIKYE